MSLVAAKPTTIATVEFADGAAAGSTGCNLYQAPLLRRRPALPPTRLRCILAEGMSELRTVETTAGDVTRLLDLLGDESVEGWVAGGWGIDALVGHQSRSHRDLDLLIPLQQILTTHRLLLSDGFVVENDWYPLRFEMIHPTGRAVDIHPIRLDGDGGGRLELEDGGWWECDAEALSGQGTIADRACRCLSVSEQIRCHTGYKPTDKDVRDMNLLATRFDVRLPPPYA